MTTPAAFPTDEVMAVFAKDPIITNLIQNGLPLKSSRSEDLYLKLVGSIVSQQLSTKVAAVIFRRFTELFPETYPHPHLVLEASDETLRSAGLSFQKMGYIRNVAAFAAEGNMAHAVIDAMEDEALIQHLTQIKGVGRWTVEMLLMFALERPDVFPVDDLGIQNAMKKHYGFDLKGKELKLKMQSIAESWRPYRTIASKYLWQSLDNAPA
ncbi:DNA-3-methyladenine glycosylase family protein [Pontibacter akesuensis]|uniref:DNA-3-methyladenine glycosylase II n=1 Tax=Pontibacter akesuensis TaxID=388950 RepID=A0A1I7FXA3_9BACT|nr:DNA-3-methyladenine glycosylase [Pontibacter akesuensis]GHA60055.1 DNA-3-methyladenine glycosylase [Pontibacter akesuensis]SFU40787.1 DNA-3-methyladenine glycosylase II [Pontibacter akesuensis]